MSDERWEQRRRGNSRQGALLALVRAQGGVWTVARVKEALGVTTTHAHVLLGLLERDGVLVRNPAGGGWVAMGGPEEAPEAAVGVSEGPVVSFSPMEPPLARVRLQVGADGALSVTVDDGERAARVWVDPELLIEKIGEARRGVS